LYSALVRQCNVNGVAQRQNEWWNAVVGMVSCSSKSVVDYPVIKRIKMAMVVTFKPEPGQTNQKPGPWPQ
jgi:hypothetical protein